MTSTLSSATNTVAFTSIPQTYTDLVLVWDITATVSGNPACNLRFNSDSGTNYSYTYITSTGPATGRSANTTALWSTLSGITASRVNGFFNIMNYSNANVFKTVLCTSGDTSNQVFAVGNLWRSTSAVTRIDVGSGGADTWAAGSVFTLYGIKVA
jgi:hypothetical protein